MTKTQRNLPHPRIQRAFVRWFRENRFRFTLPVDLAEINTAVIQINFPKHLDCISACLSSSDLYVSVDCEGQYWDLQVRL